MVDHTLLTGAEIAAIQARCEAARNGPWWKTDCTQIMHVDLPRVLGELSAIMEAMDAEAQHGHMDAHYVVDNIERRVAAKLAEKGGA